MPDPVTTPKAFPRPLLVAWIALALLGVALKLFTARYYYRDDTTTGLLLRPIPSLVNVVDLTDSAEGGRRILNDENSFIGEDLHRVVTAYAWWVPAVALGLWMAYKKLLRAGFVLVVLTVGEALLGLGLAERLATVDRVDLRAAWLLPLPYAAAVVVFGSSFRRTVPRWLAVGALVCAIAFAIFLGWGDHAGRIIPYETWVKRGE